MRILLIKPYWPYPIGKGEVTYNRVWPPLSLANCAALLEDAGFYVSILDAHAERILPWRVGGFVNGFDKIFITSSSLDQWQCPNINMDAFFTTVKYIKSFADNLYIMGHHGSIRAEEILLRTEAAAIIRNEPEMSVLEICQGKDLASIKGIAYKENGSVVINEDRQPFDLDSLPPPAMHLLNFNNYFYEILGSRFSLFETARGCAYSCKFCNKLMYGDGLRRKSPQRVIQEVKVAIENFNIRTGYFIDLDFLSNIDAVDKLCDFLASKKYKFKWTCQTRADALTPGMLCKMKKAGCELIHIGVESGSQRILEMNNKQTTIGDIKKGVDMARKIGIRTACFFIFGFPSESEEEARETADLVNGLKPDYASFHIFNSFKTTFQSDKSINHNRNKLEKLKLRLTVKFYFRPFYIFSSFNKVKFYCLFRSLCLIIRGFLNLLAGKKKVY